MDYEQIRQGVYAAIRDVCKGHTSEESSIRPEHKLLGQYSFDSIDFLQFEMLLDEKFGVSIEEGKLCEELARLRGRKEVTYDERQGRKEE